LMIMTKTSAAQASETHISIIGHITIDELRRALDETSMVNGFANRFLFACVRRSKLLPFGGDLGEDDIQKLAAMTHHTLETIRVACRRIRFTDSAAAIWTDVYPQLTAERPGIFGAVTARAEAQTLRLALLYALLDERNAIDAPHLTAALAIWKYCEASARYIFGDATGDPVADEILRALRACAPDGMTRTDIYNLLGRHRSRERTGAALATLLQYGKVRRVTRPSGGGRPVEIWMAS